MSGTDPNGKMSETVVDSCVYREPVCGQNETGIFVTINPLHVLSSISHA